MTQVLDDALITLALTLPEGLLSRISRAIAGLPPDADAAACDRVARVVTQPASQALASNLMNVWREAGRIPDPAALAFALRIAAAGDARRRAEEAVQVTWSGPLAADSSLRSTEEVLLSLVDAAEADLLLSTYVAQRIDRLNAALIAALDRHVSVTLVLDSGSGADGRTRFDPERVFGMTLLGRCERLTWSEASEGGRGTIHAKCVIIDRKSMLVSSANLTGRALESNIELGVLLRGGPLPAQVRRHFDELLVQRRLVRV